MRNMRKITVSVDPETYREVRAWCAQRDTCVSHVVQEFLNELPNLESVPKRNPPEIQDFGKLGTLLNQPHLHDMETLLRTLRSR